MSPSPDQIKSLILGKELPASVVAEIERELDDPESEVSRMSREFARLTQLALGADGPLPGELRWDATNRKSDGGVK